MRILNRLFARVWNFGFGRRGDERLREEMEGHLAMQAEDNVRAGMTPTEARRQAALKLGAVEAIRGNTVRKRECRYLNICFMMSDTHCVSCANHLALR
jgi:hypothetical protein